MLGSGTIMPRNICAGDPSWKSLENRLSVEILRPEINYTMWHGLYVAKGTPREIIAALNDAMRKAVTDPDIVAKFKQLGTAPYPEKELSPEAHARLFAADLPRVAKLVEASGARPSDAQ